MIGRTLSHYRIEERIGAGGMGEVYRARDEHLDRDAAIKVLPAGSLADEHARKRFRKEAQALSKLNHPNIATVFDFDTQDDVDFIVMELVEGVALSEKLKVGPLTEKEVVAIGPQIADALEEAHERGIVHRDLKPGNIVVTSKGRVKVLDFGLARMLRPVSDEATTEAMTEELSVAGTLPYMSPEELKGERADHRSDLYSFGVVLYEMATGKRPFEKKLSTALTAAIVQKPAEPPSSHNRKISPGLEGIILKALDKDPDHRYQSAREMRVDLERLSTPVSLAVPKRKPVRSSRWLWAAVGIVGVIAAVILLNVGGLRDALVGESGPRIDSIAVLPFENLSGDPEQEYFSDGMTDALIADLAKIGALRVISRQSLMQFKGSAAPLSEIARKLSVDAVVQGSVLHSGNRVRITTHLFQVSPERHLWADSYEKDLRDILALQRELARQIAREIEAEVTPEVKKRLASSRSVNPEAHKAYLKGKYIENRYEPEEWFRAIELYEQAIEKDPQYAPAYAAMAFLLAEIPNWHPAALPEEYYPRARDAAQKAIELDDALAEAHLALGRIAHYFGWDWEEAESRFQRAIELEPGSVNAHRMYGVYLVQMGQTEDGIAEGKLAVELDPLSLVMNTALGTILYYARRYDEAAEQLTNVLDMDPTLYGTHGWLFFTYAANQRYEDAFATCQDMKALSATPLSQNCYIYAHALLGNRDEALRAARATQWFNSPVSAWPRAVVYGALGEKDEAFRSLGEAYKARASHLAIAKVDPRLDPLRDDPRFHDFLRRMNFPD